jgi:hypothetical protein
VSAQAHETLILDGRRLSMAFCPPLPEGHPRLVRIDAGPHDQRSDLEHLAYSTACWRRYVGTWEIQEGCFYLVAIVGSYALTGSGPLIADWFTGVLRVPHGKVLEHIHIGFASVYEFELHIRIEDGRVIDRRTISNRGTSVDRYRLGMANMPGFENGFEGDDYWD